MEIEKLKSLPKNFLKEALQSVFKLEKLKQLKGFSGVHFNDAEKKLAENIDSYRSVEKEALKSWRVVELSRNENRPHTPDYIKGIFGDFIEMSGDRNNMEDKSIIAGFGKIAGQTVAIIGHNKGKDIKERVLY